MGNSTETELLPSLEAYPAVATDAGWELPSGRETLATLDATSRLFEPTVSPELMPAIRPAPHGLFFRYGEQMRLCVDALRQAQRPLSARLVAEYAIVAKGLPADNAPILASITVQVRVALGRLEVKGTVQDHQPARCVVDAGDSVRRQPYRF